MRHRKERVCPIRKKKEPSFVIVLVSSKDDSDSIKKVKIKEIKTENKQFQKMIISASN